MMKRPKGLGTRPRLAARRGSTGRSGARRRAECPADRAPAARQVPAAHAHEPGGARRTRGLHPRPGRDAADPRAPGRSRSLRNHRGRAPLSRGADGGPHRSPGPRQAGSGHRGPGDGVDREHPARGPEPARGSAGRAAPDPRVRLHARAGGSGHRPLAQRHVEPAAAAEPGEAGAGAVDGRAASTWVTPGRCWAPTPRTRSSSRIASSRRACPCARRKPSSPTRRRTGGGGSKKAAAPRSRDIVRLEEELADKLGATVRLSANAKGSGKLVIEFASLDQLDGIVERLRGSLMRIPVRWLVAAAPGR